MDAAAIALAMATVFAWGALSARLGRADLTAPIVFVAVGALVHGVLDVSASELSPDVLKGLAEITLVLVLFSDASRVAFRDFRGDLALYARLLGIGLPLTVVGGWVVAAWLLPGVDVWLALLVGAALAPTDAALGLAVVTNPVVPAPIRRVLNVESGLNDGIVTPVVMVAVAGAATAEHVSDAHSPADALVELLVGVLAGAVLGFLGGRVLRFGRRRDWASKDFIGPAVLALAVLAYVGSLAVEGNGFVAAFVAGLLFRAATGRRTAGEVEFAEQASGLASLLVWMLFGLAATPIVLDSLGWQVIVYAMLSLTLIRMVPVALALLGSKLDRVTVVFIGWFGPRGLASLIFALLAVEELGPGADEAVTAIALTVLASVLAHGFSAGPLAVRYGRAESAATLHEPAGTAPEPEVRGLPRRHRPTISDRGGPPRSRD